MKNNSKQGIYIEINDFVKNESKEYNNQKVKMYLFYKKTTILVSQGKIEMWKTK